MLEHMPDLLRLAFAQYRIGDDLRSISAEFVRRYSVRDSRCLYTGVIWSYAHVGFRLSE